MAKLPIDLVQAPVFDSPLRRTDVPPLSVVENDSAPSTRATSALATSAIREEKDSSVRVDADARADDLTHRSTVRLTQPQWEALQRECLRRRLAGHKTNLSDLIRNIVDDWVNERTAAAPTSTTAGE